ncbi:putative bifunctional diguanylate cyclase/phosphodiesterase [Aromatoleum petrolei]|uniref:EAL domain-containing protein n=1 Tax=Aromatoleum petrolei TaxID=76116 RepID=A0ABX1MPD0_9RHOO|nr:EAL domain-containing protein [Aromatoleum petrolei]NMF89809.1 EAL domain-containing protein [Aromatoleum petrolei]QTQ35070.1 Diguanylate cyclase (GGDEF) domain-containing protein [Aromatoleum petrolei]
MGDQDSKVDAKAGAFKVVLAYAVFGALWILLSDQALGVLFRDPDVIVKVSQGKGWVFVAITALLLYALLMRLVGRLDQSLRREFASETERRRAEEQVHNLSFYDSLTSLPNRRLLFDRLGQSLLACRRSETRGAVLFIDLDGFRALNDTRGHEVGDRLLVEVARRIAACVHREDTVARAGSDEFVVVANGLNAEKDAAAVAAREIAERIQGVVRQPFDVEGHEVQSSVSIGISMFSGVEGAADELLKQADASMFEARSRGRDGIHFFDVAMQAALDERVRLEGWLRKALPDQLRLYYQMQVDGNGSIQGAEVLIRWLHPERGMIPPCEFIPLAEETGMILAIGRWVLETACRQLKDWEGDPATRHLKLSVNVSARQFQQDEFDREVLEVVKKTGADPANLKLELTESMVVENIDQVVHKMAVLKATGIQFSLDDFGTGFSSLSCLRRLPLDQLKIDQSFVRDVTENANDAAIVRTIIALGQSLGLEVIAEGVETAEQRNFLAVHGCSNFQGYFFSRPVPLEEFEQQLAAHRRP